MRGRTDPGARGGMEARAADGGPGRRGPGAPQAEPNDLPKHSYWLDLWLFVLLDVVLFLFVYLLP